MSTAATTPAARATAWARWPHRIAALIVAGICLRAWYQHRIGGSWTMIPLNLIPFALLEGLGRLSRTRMSSIVFGVGALAISATVALHLPYFSGHSGEWSRLNYVLIPALQVAGVVALGAVLGVLRLLGR